MKKRKSKMRKYMSGPFGDMYFFVAKALMLLVLIPFCLLKISHAVENWKMQKQYEQYAKTDDNPMVYVMMLDNSSSMQENFRNLDKQPLDCLMVYQSLLQNDDKLAVFPLINDGEEMIEITGTEDIDAGQEKISGISLYEADEKESVSAWIRNVNTYLSEVEDAHVRVLVLTDKSQQELDILDQLETDTNSITLYASALDFYAGLTNQYYVVRCADGDTLFEGMFNTDYYRNYHGYHESKFGYGKALHVLDYRLQEPVNNFTVILSGEEANIINIGGFGDGISTHGTLLSDGRILYRYTTEMPTDSFYIIPDGSGTVTLLYPTSDGKKIVENAEDGLAESMIAMPFILFLLPPVVYYVKQFKQWKHRKKKRIFISYRRDGAATLAHAIAERLRVKQYVTYLDTESLKGEKFNERLFWEIERSDCVVAVIPNDGLARCIENQDDWVRKELAWALYNNIPIVPVLMDGYEMPKNLPLDISGLPFCNAVKFDDKNYYQESMNRVEGFVDFAVKKSEAIQKENN